MSKQAKQIRVVVAEPGKPAEVRMIPADDGEALRALVGGWLECVPLWDGKHDIWLNEEGKLMGLEPNRMVRAPGAPINGRDRGFPAWDIVGTLVVAAHDDEGNTTSIEASEAERIADALTGVTTMCRPLLAEEVQVTATFVADWED